MYQVLISVGVKTGTQPALVSFPDTEPDPTLSTAHPSQPDGKHTPDLLSTCYWGFPQSNRSRYKVSIPYKYVRDTYTQRTFFGIAENLAVDLLLGASYIDWSTRGIFPTDQKVLKIHSRPVVIIKSLPKSYRSSRRTSETVRSRMNRGTWRIYPVEKRTLELHNGIHPVYWEKDHSGWALFDRGPQRHAGKCHLMIAGGEMDIFPGRLSRFT